MLRVAAEHDLAVVARGAGTDARLGRRPRRAVDLRRSTPRGMTGVVEHAAGDLVVVVAGRDRRSRELQDVLAGGGPASWRSTTRCRARRSAASLAIAPQRAAPAAATARCATC